MNEYGSSNYDDPYGQREDYGDRHYDDDDAGGGGSLLSPSSPLLASQLPPPPPGGAAVAVGGPTATAAPPTATGTATTIDFDDPAISSLPRILLMGPRRAGKTSIQVCPVYSKNKQATQRASEHASTVQGQPCTSYTSSSSSCLSLPFFRFPIFALSPLFVRSRRS